MESEKINLENEGDETYKEELEENENENIEEEETEVEIDMEEFFNSIGIDKDTPFTDKTMEELEEDLDYENKTPKERIVFVPAKRFSNFNYHYPLQTYLPFTVDLSEMSLLTLDGIEFMYFLSYVNARNNLISDRGLQYIESVYDLIALVLEGNRLTVLKIPKMKELMYLDVSKNCISWIHSGLDLPSLETLIMNNNRVDDLKLLGRKNLPKLNYISVRNNMVKDVKVQWSRHLTYLFLADNEISDVKDLAGLYKLRTLHLRSNRITRITDFPTDLVSLDYLNLRENHISDISSVKVLAALPLLKTLIVTGNPCTFQGESDENYRVLILSYLPNLKRIDKEKVTKEELMKAEAMNRIFEGGEEEASDDDEFK